MIRNPGILSRSDSMPVSFAEKLGSPLGKTPVSVLQINLGKRCNLACTHCHVEASPKRSEELSPEVCHRLIEVIDRFPEIQVVDLTGGAPEMLYGFQPLVEAARERGKEAIVRSNLTIYFEEGFGHIPEYCAEHQVRIIASLPCYLADNVDRSRGMGVYHTSIQALQWLNRLGYGRDPRLVLDLVYNPPIPTSEENFLLAPDQKSLERDYKKFLAEQFDISFNHLLTITNLPIGRIRSHLERTQLYAPYLHFLASRFNSNTVEHLMCRNQLSIDYLGNVYDCDFNQMTALPARTRDGKTISIATLLEAGTLALLDRVQTASHCYGCTAGCGSSCGGALT